MVRHSRTYQACMCLVVLLACVLFALSAATPVAAKEYRAWWVDGWGGGFMNQTQVNQLLSDVRAANCNAIFVEVRRSADVAYVGHMGEPYMSGLTPSNFDALQAIINAAHDTSGGKKRIEVHCWMVVFRTDSGTVYSNHHSTPTGSLTTLDNYWLTRDSSGAENTADQPLDPGHPLVEDYLTQVYTDIVNNYDIDGIHYDYVRFIANNLGYNPTSVARYNNRYGLSGTPTNTGSQWKQWRRDQITNLVRRIYHRVQIVKPTVAVSGSFVCGAPGPSTPDRAGFTGTTNLQAYTQYYQDWDAWVREGIVDMAVPMTYFDLAGSYVADWNKWINYQKDNHTNRHMLVGPGVYLNSISNAIACIQQTRTASSNGNYANGFSGYEYQEPYAGGTWSGWASTFTSQVTPTWDDVPDRTWKTSPTTGSLQGTALNGAAWVDGAHITTTAGGDQYTDGTGFYGFLNLAPGTYSITCDATAQGLGTQTKSFTIVAGQATVVNFTWGTTTGMSGYIRTSGGAAVVGARLVGPNGGYLTTSGSDGSYTLPGMTAGSYSFKAQKTGYNSQTQTVTVTNGATTNANFTIDPIGGVISGYVRDSQGHGVSGASVIAGAYTTTSAADGSYALSNVTGGTYSVVASLTNYSTQTVNNVSVTNGVTTTLDLTIDPNATVISSVAASSITSTSAVITWTTNVPATSQVEYGKTSSMGTLTTLDGTLVTSHSVTLSGLTQNHIYSYRVTSANSLGNSAMSVRNMFFTLPPSGAGTTIIIDNSDTGWAITAGAWSTGTSSTDKYGSDYRFANNTAGSDTNACTWTPTIPSAGTYDVYIWYPQGSNRAPDAPFTIYYQGGSTTIDVNQQSNGGKWNQIGSSLPFAAGTSGYVKLTSNSAASVVLADAVKFVSTASSDATAPTVPTGLTATALSTSQIQLNWSASTDASGIGGYKIYRNGVLLDAVDSGTTYTDSGLTTNTSYSYTIAAFDTWQNTSAQSTALAKSTLCLPVSVTCNKATSTWQTGSNAFTFTNATGFGGLTIDHVRYVWDRNATHTWTDAETSWTSGTLACTANPGGNNWYLHARPYNADNVANGQVDLGPYFCDLTTPGTPVLATPKYTSSTTQLTCTWGALTDSESGIVEYQYAIGKTSGGTDVRYWTTAGVNTGVTASGLTLLLDQPYYFSVKAKNGAGLWSTAGNSTSTIPAHVCASIMDAKALANDSAVTFSSRGVSYCASDGAFVQDTNKPSALFVPSITTLSADNIVNISGLLGTSGQLRTLTNPEWSVIAGSSGLKPVAMTCSSLGGVAINQWTPGLPNGFGANNIGVLVKVYGTVTSSTSTYFMISDGRTQVQVKSTANPGSGHVMVTGISSTVVYNSQTIPLVITRSTTDVKKL